MPVPIQRITFPDNMESIIKKLRSILQTNINTYITEQFASRITEDTAELGEVVPTPVISSSNVIIGNFNTIKLNMATIPSILIDYDSEQFARVLTMKASNPKAYNLKLYVCVMYDDIRFINYGLLRPVQGLVQLLADYGTLEWKANDGAVQQVTYSLPIQYQSGWFRGAAVQMSYNGRVGG